MQIVDTASQHRAVLLQPSESLDSRTIVAALVAHGYSPAVALESANTLLDALEAYVHDQKLVAA